MHEKDYAARVKTRGEEMEAINGAMEVLTGDDARDLFTASLGGTKSSEKLGSKNLEEFKEERDTESMRSQTSKARKKQWGTAERYLQFPALVQINEHDFVNDADFKFEKDPITSKLSVLTTHSSVKKTDFDKTPDAKKLAELATRTEQYWKAAYYNQAA